MVIGAEDKAEVKSLNTARREYKKSEQLLVPDGEDRRLAGKVINALQHELKFKQGGLTPKLPAEEKTALPMICYLLAPQNALV